MTKYPMAACLVLTDPGRHVNSLDPRVGRTFGTAVFRRQPSRPKTHNLLWVNIVGQRWGSLGGH
jgi:hypothetical protein